jgi:type I restriction enzyme M protein
MAIEPGDRPRALIEKLSEDTLATFAKAKLLDPYDMYQHLMDYWDAMMQDDVYLIADSGWVQAARPRLIVEAKDQQKKEEPDFTVGNKKYKSDLLPASLLTARYFSREQVAIQALEAELDAAEQKIEDTLEEPGGEDGLLEDVVEGEGEKRKITRKSIKTRVKEIGDDPDFDDELKAIQAYAADLDARDEAKDKLKAARAALNDKVAEKYGSLSEPEVKKLAVDDKWLAQITADVQGELDHVSQTLTGRIRQLAERYATPLPQLAQEVEAITDRVNKHLKKMGAKWN